jgi:hypothetical protein
MSIIAVEKERFYELLWIEKPWKSQLFASRRAVGNSRWSEPRPRLGDYGSPRSFASRSAKACVLDITLSASPLSSNLEQPEDCSTLEWTDYSLTFSYRCCLHPSILLPFTISMLILFLFLFVTEKQFGMKIQIPDLISFPRTWIAISWFNVQTIFGIFVFTDSELIFE